jgi:hypothetical protein
MFSTLMIGAIWTNLNHKEIRLIIHVVGAISMLCHNLSCKSLVKQCCLTFIKGIYATNKYSVYITSDTIYKDSTSFTELLGAFACW